MTDLMSPPKHMTVAAYDEYSACPSCGETGRMVNAWAPIDDVRHARLLACENGDCRVSDYYPMTDR